MHSRITRIIAAIMALVMLACCFSACKGKDADDDTTTSSTTSPIEFPTNPEDVFVNDGSDVDPDGPDKAPNVPTGNNGSSNNGGSNNGGSYYPPINNPTIPSTTKKPATPLDLEWWEAEGKHFLTHIDTPEERAQFLTYFGYEYDKEQNIYYTHLNPWQRYFGFADIYDQAAPYTNMRYLTLKIDFRYQGKEDLLWRLQWWKGQYGILEGAELGVYTKKPHNVSQPFYKCAEDDNLLRMSFDYYHSLAEYEAKDRLFTRYEQEHWWLTGFKFGNVAPRKSVIVATLYAKDDAMADGIELGLQNITDANGNLTAGFKPYVEGGSDIDTYIRTGNKFVVVWKDVGYLNYGVPENPSEPNPDVNIPEEGETV